MAISWLLGAAAGGEPWTRCLSHWVASRWTELQWIQTSSAAGKCAAVLRRGSRSSHHCSSAVRARGHQARTRYLAITTAELGLMDEFARQMTTSKEELLEMLLPLIAHEARVARYLSALSSLPVSHGRARAGVGQGRCG
jgi:hypothetical protein